MCRGLFCQAMRIHFITKHQLTDQSSRMRVGQYLPYFAREDIHVSVSSFYSPELQAIVYTRRNYARKAYYAVRSVIDRFLEVPRVRESDIVFIHREITPFFFTTVEAQYHRAG